MTLHRHPLGMAFAKIPNIGKRGLVTLRAQRLKALLKDRPPGLKISIEIEIFNPGATHQTPIFVGNSEGPGLKISSEIDFFNLWALRVLFLPCEEFLFLFSGFPFVFRDFMSSVRIQSSCFGGWFFPCIPKERRKGRTGYVFAYISVHSGAVPFDSVMVFEVEPFERFRFRFLPLLCGKVFSYLAGRRFFFFSHPAFQQSC